MLTQILSTINSVRFCQYLVFTFGQGHPVTLTKGQGHSRSCHFKGLPTGYLLTKFGKSTINSLQNMNNIYFLTFSQGHLVTLTKPQGHPRTCHCEDLSTSHLWCKFEKSAMNSLWDMVNIQFFTKVQDYPVTLIFGQGHSRSCHFEGLPTSHLWSKFEKSTMNSLRDMVNIQLLTKGQGHRVTWVHVILKVFPQATFSPSLRSLP